MTWGTAVMSGVQDRTELGSLLLCGCVFFRMLRLGVCLSVCVCVCVFVCIVPVWIDGRSDTACHPQLLEKPGRGQSEKRGQRNRKEQEQRRIRSMTGWSRQKGLDTLPQRHHTVTELTTRSVAKHRYRAIAAHLITTTTSVLKQGCVRC